MSSSNPGVVEINCAATDAGTAKPLSVLLLIRSLELGGAQRQLVQLADGLHRRGCSVSAVTLYPDGPLDADLEKAGVRVIELRKAGRWDVVGTLLRLRRAVRDAQPDVLYGFVGTANLFAAILRPFLGRTKLILSVRASDMDLARYDWPHRVSYQVERRLSRVADHIIANSRAGLEFAVANGFPRERMTVVPNGIDTARFRPDPSLRSAQRTRWGLSEREIAIGMLARLDPMKGHADFLRAAAKVAAEYEEAKFLCIGDGAEEESLKALAVELGVADRVLFTGPTHDPVAALNGLDLFCSASVWGEGFSNAIGEAMACDRCCVVTDVGDSATIVGGCGEVVPPSRPDVLARAIIEQLRLIRGGASTEGRKRIVENFSVEAMVERTLAVLRAPCAQPALST